MIENKYIIDDVQTAIKYLSAIKEVFERDGMIHERYVLEKLNNAHYIIAYLIGQLEKENEHE